MEYYLKLHLKGGRINKRQSIIGNLLNLKPILHVQNGKMEIIEKIRVRKKLLNRVVDIVQQRIKKFLNQIIGICHADDLETALEIKDMLVKKLEITK